MVARQSAAAQALAAGARIALVGPTHPYKGGIAQHTTALAHRLAEAGYAVELVSWSEQYPRRLYPGEQRVADPERPESPIFPRTSYPLSWRRPDSWWRAGRRLRAAADCVVVVVVSPVQVPAYLVLLRALGRRTPVIALCHNVLPHEPRRMDAPLVRALLRRADGVLVHTPAERERALGLLSNPSSKAARETISKVAVATMAPFFNASPTSPIAHAPERPPRRRLLFFGLVRPYKGLDVLIEALAKGPPDVTLTVAGEFWTPVEEARAQAEALGVADRLEIRPGYVAAEDVPALFAGVDALVLPYRAGTATQNVELAFTHGLPVVVTRAGSMALAVRDGIDGLVIPAGDAVALSAALRRLYEPGVLATLRASVQPPASDSLWESYVSRVVSLARVTACG
jgi:D-inositol-3-phosphate glycosyltransferase